MLDYYGYMVKLWVGVFWGEEGLTGLDCSVFSLALLDPSLGQGAGEGLVGLDCSVLGLQSNTIAHSCSPQQYDIITVQLPSCLCYHGYRVSVVTAAW